jgi:hypothetical protein
VLYAAVTLPAGALAAGPSGTDAAPAASAAVVAHDASSAATRAEPQPFAPYPRIAPRVAQATPAGEPPLPATRNPERLFDPAARIEANRSYAIPALEIVGFDFLLNRYDNAFEGPEYKVTLDSIRRNLRHGWVADNDPFEVNQFLHPYQGGMYHGFARSAGLDYWTAAGYTFLGSAMWEVAGETTPPSRNDQIASGIAGSFLGEALFRMASLLLEHDELPPLVRELGAAVISPPTGFNRLAFGERFRTVFPSHDPERYSRLAVGGVKTVQNLPGPSGDVRRNEAQVDYSIDYGLPGKPGYTYERPFDYFAFQATLSTANTFENILTRGLLYGSDYALGGTYRGIFGVYGSYDYIAPQVFRVSSTALSLGTTGQWSPRDAFTLQGTALLGAGYAGVGTLRVREPSPAEDRDYHYGLAPQALLSLRFIFGERASLDVTGREYFVSRVAGASTGGHDNILRADTALTWRISGPHALSLRYLWSHRDASSPELGDRSQTRGTIGLFYTYLGHDRFGAVKW